MVNLLESINVQTNAPLDSRTVVKALSNRDAISTTVRYLGMKVYVSDEKKEYRLEDGIENSHWKEIKGVTNLSEMVSDNNHMTVSKTEKDKWDGKAEGNHNHDTVYAKTSHKHNASEVTGLPTALKNPTALTIQLNGKNDVVYDGSVVKSVNITAAGIGAQPSGNYAQATHTHVATQVTEDSTHRFVTDTDKSNWNGKAAGNHNHDSAYTKIGHGHSWGEISGKPGSFTPSGHNQASNTITAMTGYSKPTSTSAIVVGDTLNAAIGKLEKALDGKQPTGSYASASHNHDTVYAKSSHTHTASQVSGLPTALKNPTALSIQLNGGTANVYDGSAAKSINITPASIGAQVAGSYASSSHNHDTAYAPKTHTHTEYLSANGNVTVNGNLTVTGEILSNNNVTAYSDIRVKKNIRDIDDSVIEKLKKVRFCNFEYKDCKDDRKRVGVIAQELEELFPELVFEDHNGIKTVDYISLNVYFAFAMQKKLFG